MGVPAQRLPWHFRVQPSCHSCRHYGQLYSHSRWRCWYQELFIIFQQLSHILTKQRKRGIRYYNICFFQKFNTSIYYLAAFFLMLRLNDRLDSFSPTFLDSKFVGGVWYKKTGQYGNNLASIVSLVTSFSLNSGRCIKLFLCLLVVFVWFWGDVIS